MNGDSSQFSRRLARARIGRLTACACALSALAAPAFASAAPTAPAGFTLTQFTGAPTGNPAVVGPDDLTQLGDHVFVGWQKVDAGLVTAAPDDLDWEDELRQAIESRAAQSPDALTGLEANLRFGGNETMETRIFGRLSAWQNWIFIRPNAVGANGALKVYGTGAPVKFNWERV